MKGEEFVAHGFLDAFVTEISWTPGADLHGVGAEQNKLRGVVAVFPTPPRPERERPGNSWAE